MRGNKRDGGIGALKLPFKNARVLVKPGLEKLCIATLFLCESNVPRFFFPFTSTQPRTRSHRLVLRNFLRKLVLFVYSLFVIVCAVNRV